MQLTEHHCSLVDHSDLQLNAMAFKFVLFAALVAYAQAGYLAAPAAIATPVLAAAPIGRQVITKVSDAEYSYPQYSYSYNVADSISGDFKHAAETRDGNVVRGSYGLLDSDGTRRQVDYIADELGFRAAVSKNPAAAVAIPAPAPIAVKTAIPALPAAAIPAAYPAPVAAPIARFASPALPLAAAPAPLPLAAAPAAYPYSAYPYAAYPAFAAPGIFRSGPIIKNFY